MTKPLSFGNIKIETEEIFKPKVQEQF